MQLSTRLGGTCLLALLPWSPPVDAAAPQDEPRRITQQERIAAVTEDLLGAWQLVRATLRGSVVSGGDAAGYLMVQPDYLAFEVHMRLPSDLPPGSPAPYFQSRTARWRFTNETNLETSTLIGNTNIGTRLERWDFEPVGTKRSLVARVSETTLVLERPGESRLEFRRLARLPFPGQPIGFEGREPKKDGDE